MDDDNFLYKELNGARKYGTLKTLPDFVASNLNPSFELRPYQRAAFENFITHFESDNCPRPTQVLFHMATGSGKTLIMAGLILYLYARGYRNFLFFVNLSNIVGKTRENFLDAASRKYLFAEQLIIEGRRIRVNVTDNFQYAEPDAINICFATTQGLHMTLNFPRENGMTFDDFNERRVVLISDEAHHLNVDTKKKSSAEDRETWENTIEHIFRRNASNVLLEFTATCNLANPSIRAKYADKIVFDYPLQKFYNDGYSKDIIALRSDKPLWERALQALILSQYRLKLFEDERLGVKPVVLFKARTIKESATFQSEFVERVKHLTADNLRGVFEHGNEVINAARGYFTERGVTLEALAAELREDFSEEHCISANDERDAGKNRDWLNTLEDLRNPYRAVFEVKKLDEGWDVLNLFDIVRLYETRSQSTTLAEAQLIGRGARYYPFTFDGERKYQRKFDADAASPLRVCETLYYHCENDSRYISELHKALHDLGLDLCKVKRCEYKLKQSFKESELYRSGVIFVNRRVEAGRRDVRDKIANAIYSYEATTSDGRDKLMVADLNSRARADLHTTRKTIGDIAAKNYAIVNKALMRQPIYYFATLRTYFPELTSTRQFVKEYLSGVQIDITSSEVEPTVATLYDAVCHVADELAEVIAQNTMTYRGTRDFHALNINDVFRNKVVEYTEPHEGGIGDKQKDVDLSAADWFAYEENYGTSEEKAFVKYFKNQVDKLKPVYDKIYLVRNERAFHVHAFEDGARFEPDFVLFLQRAEGSEQWQIFIEPKGAHLAAKDAWKENFLEQLKDTAKLLSDDSRYRIWGLPFYNQADIGNFDKEFRKLFEP